MSTAFIHLSPRGERVFVKCLRAIERHERSARNATITLPPSFYREDTPPDSEGSAGAAQ